MTPDKANTLANDISCVIATLQAIADELMTAYPDSDCSRDDDTEVEAVETPVPETPKPTVTLEQVRSVLSEKSRDGMTTQVKGLLTKYGANRLSDIDSSNFAALLSDAEGLKK